MDKDLSVSEEEENAFEASFNATDLEPSALLEEPAPGDEPEPQETPGPAEEPVPAAIPAGLTLDDLKAMIENQQQEHIKTRDKFFGKIGELQQKIDAARSTVSGISPKARERLQTDFPELAEMLFDGEETPVAQPDPQPHYEPQEDKTEAIRQEMELKFLNRDHKDWRTVVASKEFEQWKTDVLEPGAALELDSTWDSGVISERLTEFKEWKANSMKKKQADTSRLESAITPRGLPRGNAPSMIDDDEESAMEASFRKRN